MQFQSRAYVGEVSLALVRDRVIFLLVTQRRQLHTYPYSHHWLQFSLMHLKLQIRLEVCYAGKSVDFYLIKKDMGLLFEMIGLLKMRRSDYCLINL